MLLMDWGFCFLTSPQILGLIFIPLISLFFVKSQQRQFQQFYKFSKSENSPHYSLSKRTSQRPFFDFPEQNLTFPSHFQNENCLSNACALLPTVMTWFTLIFDN